MLIVIKRRYKKQHVIGGAGIFDTIVNFFKRMATSNAAKALASKLTSAAQTELGKKAIEVGKTAAKEIGLKAIDVGKDVAITKARQLIDRAAPKVLTPQTQELIKQLTGLQPNIPVLTQKSKDTLTSLINMGANEAGTNINRLLAGSGVPSAGNQNAIAIQDLVKRLSTGAGLRLA